MEPKQQFEGIEIETDNSSEDVELSLDDLETSYVAHPKVGEETPVMEILKLKATKDVDKRNADGEAFSIALRLVTEKATLHTFWKQTRATTLLARGKNSIN